MGKKDLWEVVSMLISTKGRYALRVLIDMAEHEGADYVPLKAIAKRQEISEKYLESIAKLLVKGGILAGARGKGGGYRLRLTEGTLAPVACLEEGVPVCARTADCRTYAMWQGLDQVISQYLDRFTIADLVQTGQPESGCVI